MKVFLALLIPSATAFMVGRKPACRMNALSATVQANGYLNSLNEQQTTVAAVPKFAQRWRKSTKQVVTLGPASSTPEMIEKLFLAGADVFRLNFSHGSQEQKLELLKMIRGVEEKYSHPIAILGDLQGPKLRVGEFSNPEGEMLEKGQRFRLDLDPAKGDANRVQLPHPEIISASKVGDSLLVDDGKVKLVVTGKGDTYLDCEVVVDGRIKDRKGVNTPDTILEISPLTPKDRSDLEYMLGIGVDWVALSFVQTPADIEEILSLIDEKLPEGTFKPAVMAKIEKPSCFDGDNLERLVELCNGIMVRPLTLHLTTHSFFRFLTFSLRLPVEISESNVRLKVSQFCRNKSLTNVAIKGSLLSLQHRCLR